MAADAAATLARAHIEKAEAEALSAIGSASSQAKSQTADTGRESARQLGEIGREITASIQAQAAAAKAVLHEAESLRKQAKADAIEAHKAREEAAEAAAEAQRTRDRAMATAAAAQSSAAGQGMLSSAEDIAAAAGLADVGSAPASDSVAVMTAAAALQHGSDAETSADASLGSVLAAGNSSEPQQEDGAEEASAEAAATEAVQEQPANATAATEAVQEQPANATAATEAAAAEPEAETAAAAAEPEAETAAAAAEPEAETAAAAAEPEAETAATEAAAAEPEAEAAPDATATVQAPEPIPAPAMKLRQLRGIAASQGVIAPQDEAAAGTPMSLASALAHSEVAGETSAVVPAITKLTTAQAISHGASEVGDRSAALVAGMAASDAQRPSDDLVSQTKAEASAALSGHAKSHGSKLQSYIDQAKTSLNVSDDEVDRVLKARANQTAGIAADFHAAANLSVPVEPVAIPNVTLPAAEPAEEADEEPFFSGPLGPAMPSDCATRHVRTADGSRLAPVFIKQLRVASEAAAIGAPNGNGSAAGEETWWLEAVDTLCGDAVGAKWREAEGDRFPRSEALSTQLAVLHAGCVKGPSDSRPFVAKYYASAWHAVCAPPAGSITTQDEARILSGRDASVANATLHGADLAPLEDGADHNVTLLVPSPVPQPDASAVEPSNEDAVPKPRPTADPKPGLPKVPDLSHIVGANDGPTSDEALAQQEEMEAAGAAAAGEAPTPGAEGAAGVGAAPGLAGAQAGESPAAAPAAEAPEGDAPVEGPRAEPAAAAEAQLEGPGAQAAPGAADAAEAAAGEAAAAAVEGPAAAQAAEAAPAVEGPVDETTTATATADGAEIETIAKE
ncbi:hypothetical protein FNF29_05792 [Cafeteria roenbergensis]|uniref:Uncharacterized protein n=1 Tax=Cafeteria roenbergensis TaxID=33653 RepID=A0A5A8CC31_CAFRO|nr:hypothetical protein FNF29_05792 [Cafeteria roenbergensis]|eukprot:KAA0149580.1 hypothetical protein FNF29_05792 [Cafeteria roenbergensis]